jgi:hypothetical protein
MVSHLQLRVNFFSLFGSEIKVVPLRVALGSKKNLPIFPFNSLAEQADGLKRNLYAWSRIIFGIVNSAIVNHFL